MATRHNVPWIFWPLVALWDMVASVLEFTGRLMGATIGCALMGIGILFTLTLIGAPIGIPLAILGFLLMLRSIF